MRYTGSFVNIDEQKYTVEITNSSGSGTATITFSGEPCTIEWTGEDENIFKPIKYSSATFEYVSDQYYFDLYSSTPLYNKVKLFNNSGSLFWQGYITPNVYDNSYDYAIDYKTIECVDGLAILEYLDYDTVGGGAKKVVNFLQIIKHIIDKINLTYNYLYIDGNVIVDNRMILPNGEILEMPYDIISYLEQCYISECNFFDEDDKPMKCKEVLEEICKYFNLTMYCEGANIYMIDYCALNEPDHLFFRYNLNNGLMDMPSVTKTYTINNSTDLISKSNISIGNTYNKVSVESDVYPFDKMIPDLFDDVDQVGDLYYDYLSDKEGYYFYMFLKNPNYRSYYYNKDTYSKAYPSTINYNTIQNYFGATLVKHSFETYGDPGIVNNVNWGNYLLIHLHQSKDDTYGKLPIFETDASDLDERILAHYNNYLVIDGTATYYDIEDYTAKVEHSRKDDDYADSKVTIPCSLCYGGNKWYSDRATSTEIMGTTVWFGGWVDYETTFDLPFYSATHRDHYIGKDFDVRNNIMWYDGLESSKGRKILLNTGMQIANLKFTMYAPKTPNNEYRLDYIFIKDFSIKLETSKNLYNTESPNDFIIYSDELLNPNTNDTNIIYENEINDQYVEEMDTITNKINTFAKQQVANSTVAVSFNNTKDYLYYADKVLIKSRGREAMKEEEYTVTRLAEQYSTPSIKLNVTLWDNLPLYTGVYNNTISNRNYYIIDSKSIDLRNNVVTYNLVEKK